MGELRDRIRNWRPLDNLRRSQIVGRVTERLRWDNLVSDIRSLGRQIGKGVLAHFTGFGVLDGAYLIAIYAVGSYIVIDTPINFVLFTVYYYWFSAGSRRWRNVGIFLMWMFAVALTVSGGILLSSPRLTPTNFGMRTVHQVGARYLLLLLVPYLLLHVKTSLAETSKGYRVLTRTMWIILKASLWSGAIVALMTIKGYLVPYHVRLMAVAIPLLLLHIVVPIWRQRQRSEPAIKVLPFSLRQETPWLVWVAATTVGIGFPALIVSNPNGVGWQYLGDSRFMIRDAAAYVVDPSPARSGRNEYYKPELLGESNGCGNSSCHPNVYAEWHESPHRNSVVEPYRTVAEQLAREAGVPSVRVCAGCHDPISLHAGYVNYGQPIFSPEGVREGISCVTCHGMMARTDALSANGALDFRFPENYYLGPLSLITMVGVWKEHSADFKGKGRNDDRLCIACHKFEKIEGTGSEAVNAVLFSPIHRQDKLIPECKGEMGCIACHMSDSLISEKPGRDIRTHGFGAKTLEYEY